MRWIRRILLGVAILLVVVLLVVGGGLWQLRSTPDWYPQQLSATELDAAADRALQAWIRAQNRLAEAHARQFAVYDRSDPAATQRAFEENKPILISFSATELNAFFLKWAHVNGWEQKLEKYMHNPQVVLHDGRLILVGEVRDLGLLPDVKASAHFEPRITSDGQLDLRLVRTMGGRAPLPEALWDNQKQRLIEAVSHRLPPLQRRARISPDGDANSEAIQAAMSKLLIQMLEHRPSEPVVFIPLNAGGLGEQREVPVRVIDVQIKSPEPGAEQRLTLTVAPMNREERDAFLQRIREPYSTATAGALE